MSRTLYSDRHGRSRGFSYEEVVRLIWDSLASLYDEGLLDESFGYTVNSWLVGEKKLSKDISVEGLLKDSDKFFTQNLRYIVDFGYRSYATDWQAGGFHSDRKDSSEPPNSFFNDEDKFYDFLELLYDIVSFPKRGANSKRHSSYSKELGQQKYRELINESLSVSDDPKVMLSNGQVVDIPKEGIKNLAEDTLKLVAEDDKLEDGVSLNDAISLYLSRSSTIEDKKRAIRELVDILEKRRSDVRTHLLDKDENELFMLANNFAIRHQNSKQKTNFDKEIWYDWMFQVNLAAVTTILKVIQSQNRSNLK